MYCRLRNQESDYPLSKYALKQETRKAKKFLDIQESVSYINGVYAAELFKKPFGLADMTRRYREKETKLTGISANLDTAQSQASQGMSSISSNDMSPTSGGGSSGGY